LEPAALAERIAQADVCLGIFGTSEKARRVIPTKAFIALAMGKALVTMDSPAAREVFSHREDAYLCEQASPQSLAEAFTALCDDPALLQRLQQNGRALYARRFSQEAIGQILRGCLESLIEAPTRRSLR
ncbi:MAG: glycosyltransferase, partial [Chloroflexi bacterium]|nr:glycosyltransferase [Chloroflexota bacterium]